MSFNQRDQCPLKGETGHTQERMPREVEGRDQGCRKSKDDQHSTEAQRQAQNRLRKGCSDLPMRS